MGLEWTGRYSGQARDVLAGLAGRLKSWSVTLDGASPWQGIRSGVAASRARRWLAATLAAVVLAGLAAAGFVGVSRYVSTFWLYRGFAPPTAPRSVVVSGKGGARRVPVILPTVRNFTMTSPALGGYPDPVYVVLPPGYSSHPAQRYPVLYLLHGFPGQPLAFLNIGQVAAIEATLVAAGRMKPMILVLPTGTNSFLADKEWANGILAGNAWDTFVARDLVKAIDSRYRTIASARGRGIGGLSEGGYGALNIGLHHPGEFNLLESWSGYMRALHITADFGHSASLLAYNSPAIWAQSVAPQLRASRTYIWFYIGSADPLAAQNRAFAAELTTLGVAHHFYVLPGKHSWGLWRSQMSQALLTASGHLSHG